MKKKCSYKWKRDSQAIASQDKGLVSTHSARMIFLNTSHLTCPTKTIIFRKNSNKQTKTENESGKERFKSQHFKGHPALSFGPVCACVRSNANFARAQYITFCCIKFFTSEHKLNARERKQTVTPPPLPLPLLLENKRDLPHHFSFS